MPRALTRAVYVHWAIKHRRHQFHPGTKTCNDEVLIFHLLISCGDNADAQDCLAKENGPNHNLQTLTWARLASIQLLVTLPAHHPASHPQWTPHQTSFSCTYRADWHFELLLNLCHLHSHVLCCSSKSSQTTMITTAKVQPRCRKDDECLIS